MSGLLQDLHYSLRLLARARGVTAAAIVLLAVGIGANTAIFSQVRAVLMRPVPGVQEPDRLVRLLRVERGQRGSNFGYPDYIDYRDQSRLLAGVAAESGTMLTFTTATTERVRAALVSGNYFSVLGVKPALGRLLAPEDDRVAGAHWVAVISQGLWQRAFASDPTAVGRSIRLNDREYRIVGVAAAEFRGMALGGSTDVWLPMMMQPYAIPRLTGTILNDRMAGWIAIYARLASGVSIDQASAEVAAVAQRLARAYPKSNEGRGAELSGGIGLYPSERANLRRLLGLLFAAVAVLLLIACCNVANLLLARATGRRREMAVRMAVGAGRIRLIRQLLTESLLLCLLAAIAGLLLAPWSLALMKRSLPPAQSALKLPVQLDATVLGFTLLLSVATGFLFGLAPALAASKTDLAGSLKDAAPASGLQRSWFSRFAVIAQVSLSLVLLIGAALVLKTIGNTLAGARGFESEHVLIGSLDLSILDYPPPRARLFVSQLEQRLVAIPGVRAASVSKTYPAAGWSDRGPIFYEGEDPPTEEERMRSGRAIMAEKNTVSPGYFGTLGTPLVAGRDFSPRDTAGAQPVAILSERLAARLWPGENPIGRRIAVPAWRQPRQPSLEIVGVAKDVKYRSLMTEAPVLLYLPLLQNHEVFLTIAVRAEGDPAALAPAVQREVAALDRNMPVFAIHTLTEQMGLLLWEQRTAAALIGLLGVLALVVTSVGLYSVMAHAVAQRTREIGIRIALGSRVEGVVWMIVRHGMTLAVAGVLAGTAGAWALSGVLSGFLYGVSPRDPATFASVALVLLAVSLAASYLPARAAARVDPVAALRHE